MPKFVQPPTYLYLAHSKQLNTFKIGTSADVRKRFQTLRQQAPDIVLIGYKKYECKLLALRTEQTFAIKRAPGQRGRRLEWLGPSKEVIIKFMNLEGAKCDSLIEITGINFPKRTFEGWIYMNATKNRQLLKWREVVGYEKALATLIAHGVSKSTAEKLLTGKYRSKPKQLLLNAIDEAMTTKMKVYE